MRGVDVYKILDDLWEEQLKTDIDWTEKRLELDMWSVHQCRLDPRFMNEFRWIERDETWRDGWRVELKQYVPPMVPFDFVNDQESQSEIIEPGPRHIALVAMKPNGRQVCFDWEGNREDMR